MRVREEVEVSDSLITRYRPRKFEDVVGQGGVVKSFRNAIRTRSSQAFLFSGPKGCGKTSLARLGAHEVGARGHGIIEVDAATYSTADAVRGLTASLALRPLTTGGGPVAKAVIIDESHRLSATAWDALLKSVEEPPEWLYWFFCTTELGKVPKTIKSRCSAYELRPLQASEVLDYLQAIAEAEELDTPGEVLELCARMAEGSPRQALSNLAVCSASANRRDAARLIADIEGSEDASDVGYQIARALSAGWSWQKMQPLLSTMMESEDVSPEGVRHTVRAYFTKLVAGAKDEAAAKKALGVLDNFMDPCGASEGFTPVVIAVGRSVF